jgi:hypothetical protein
MIIPNGDLEFTTLLKEIIGYFGCDNIIGMMHENHRIILRRANVMSAEVLVSPLNISD